MNVSPNWTRQGRRYKEGEVERVASTKQPTISRTKDKGMQGLPQIQVQCLRP